MRPARGFRLVDVGPGSGNIEISPAVALDQDGPVEVIAIDDPPRTPDPVEGLLGGMVVGTGTMTITHLGHGIGRPHPVHEVRVTGVGAAVMMYLVDMSIGQFRGGPGITVGSGFVDSPVFLASGGVPAC